ncbi:hypothetical protein LTS18_002588, partial [Coniosporium uncinatum]
DDHLQVQDKQLFRPTDRQRAALGRVYDQVYLIAKARRREREEEREEEEIEEAESEESYQYDLDVPADGFAGGEREGAGVEGEGSMAEAFYWQASHNPRTSNANYGGTVNFREGLTDAGLHEYLKASQMWHALCRESGGPRAKAPGKHTRQESLSSLDGSPLAKRLVFRRAPQQYRRTWTTEQALSIFRQMHGPRAAYRGKQAEAIQAVIDNRLQIVVVLGTGEGKSLLYQLPARLPGAGTTILVVPLVALKQDTIHALPGASCPLLLVSLDQAVQTPFLTYLNQLDVSGKLARVVIDESHLVCTADSYRRRMREVKQLRMLHCQFVLLTATLPPEIEDTFEKALLLQRPLYVRSSTIRTELEYYVVKPPSPPRGISFELGGVRTRALVYVRKRSQADVLAEALGYSTYYSDSGTEEEKAEVLTRWVKGESQLLVATSALARVDYPHVRVAFHVGEPGGGAIDYAQDVGRVGRDGYREEEGELLPENVRAIQRFLDSPRCRMVPLSQFLDREAQSCRNEATACDRCKELGLLLEGGRLVESEAEAGSEVETEERGIGNRLLTEHTRQSATDLDRFIQGLELLRGSCVICRFVGKVSKQEAEHTLDQCKSTTKWRFIGAKRRAQEQGREQKRGWLARFGACYRCGNIQAVCQEQGQGECRYKDIVMPLSWLVQYRKEWIGRVFKGLEAGLRASRDEDKYMLWLGEEATLFGEQGSNMAVITARVLEMIIEGLE